MIKKEAFLIAISLSWPLVANMPMPPEVYAEVQCADKKIGENCAGNSGYTCQMLKGSLTCVGKNRAKQPEVTAKNDIIDDQQMANTSDEAGGCTSAGMPNAASLASIILGLLLVLRRRTK